ncbi:MAG TPA: hypothetical protein VM577_21340 [Anaerovoracaceae bacterium]|nr:hypothetical protein [Anaerovoracaceae bacterium]
MIKFSELRKHLIEIEMKAFGHILFVAPADHFITYNDHAVSSIMLHDNSILSVGFVNCDDFEPVELDINTVADWALFKTIRVL